MKRTFTLILTLALVLILAGCTTSNPPTPTSHATSVATGGAAARAADTWAPGSSWVYRYESPRGSGTFEWVPERRGDALVPHAPRTR